MQTVSAPDISDRGATWAQAQAYPHKFAGIFPISGAPYLPNLRNLSNMKVMNLSSANERPYKNNYAAPDKYLKNHKDYIGLCSDNQTHVTLNRAWFNYKSFNKLLSARLNPFPECIAYRTERNRHRRAYWVEIHSIAYGKKNAEIKAQITDNNILIQARNISG